ncbi:CapA family protein [Rhizobium leguminosarum]|uniref:CapA family protein n=1 Tax=Rhizobium leguminosarum TaxID=384 RepID=UPI001C948244|nr:CapA family protein [Rhizobium leguminosarum]MBY5827758.1 CapA family protein [Rhizobium leguminosarum]
MASTLTVAVTGQSLIRHDLRDVTDDRFQKVIGVIQAADIGFTNFESTIYGRHGGWPLKGSYFGCAPPAVMAALKHVGFNVLSLANNHAFDLGPSGVLSTIEEADSEGFLYAGVGLNRRDAERTAEKQLGRWKIGLSAMDAGPGPAFMYADDGGNTRPPRPGVNRLDVSRIFELEMPSFDRLKELQRSLKSTALERANYAQPGDTPVLDGPLELDFYGTVFRRSDHTAKRILIEAQSANSQLEAIRKAASAGSFVIAYLHHHHWEPDWHEAPEWVRTFAHQCVDAGARMFVSHGAPVLQAIEIYHRAPIFYGLGNFIFHTDDNEKEWSPRAVWESAIASCAFNNEFELLGIDLTPIIVGGIDALENPHCTRLPFPVPAPREAAHRILDGLARRCEPFGTEIVRQESLGTILPGIESAGADRLRAVE